MKNNADCSENIIMSSKNTAESKFQSTDNMPGFVDSICFASQGGERTLEHKLNNN